jgi:hypothetical protein
VGLSALGVGGIFERVAVAVHRYIQSGVPYTSSQSLVPAEREEQRAPQRFWGASPISVDCTGIGNIGAGAGNVKKPGCSTCSVDCDGFSCNGRCVRNCDFITRAPWAKPFLLLANLQLGRQLRRRLRPSRLRSSAKRPSNQDMYSHGNM